MSKLKEIRDLLSLVDDEHTRMARLSRYIGQFVKIAQEKMYVKLLRLKGKK